MDDKARPRFIQQRGSSITMLENGAPVMIFNPAEPFIDVVAAVNFLRCGCPQVQLITDAELARSTWEDCRKKIDWYLACVRLYGEEFAVKPSLPPKPFIITVTRTTTTSPSTYSSQSRPEPAPGIDHP